MSRTIRKQNPRLYRVATVKTCRDGSRQHASKSCENHGGCPYCEGNKNHSTNKRKLIGEEHE